MIKIKKLSKTYSKNGAKHIALSDVNLSINHGEIFTLIGHSGAGKSTLLRMINFLEKPTSGEVYFKDTCLNHLSAHELKQVRQKMGMIFQSFNLITNKNVKDNILLPLVLQKLPIDTHKFNELIRLVGLNDKLNAFPSHLSGGQKQRVAIARALITEPDVLLCDEATSALDPETTAKILSLLQDINKKLGVTIVAITHEMDVVKALSSRFARMEHGQITEISSIKETLLSSSTDSWLFKELTPSLPETLKTKMTSQSLPGTYPICRTLFLGEVTTKAVISEISQSTNIKINILQGQISELQGIPYGVLTFQMIGDKLGISQALDQFKQHQLTIEVVGYAP